VSSQLASSGDDSPERRLVLLRDVPADDEERGPVVVPGEQIEDRDRPLGGAVVEGERDDTFRRLPPVLERSKALH